MTEVSSDSRLPLYQRLRDELAARISSQHWRPGDLIPSESELASSHGVSIGTVRKAIDSLVSEGLLERQQGRGTYVRRARFNSSLFRFFRFQSETGERKVPQARILKLTVLPAPSAVTSVLRLREGEPVINISRLRMIDGEPLLAEEIWLEKSRFEALLGVAPDAFGDLLYPLYEERCGQMVATAGRGAHRRERHAYAGPPPRARARSAADRDRPHRLQSGAAADRMAPGPEGLPTGSATTPRSDDRLTKQRNNTGGQNMSNWYSESTPTERRTFWASFGGWALDALDVQMFGLAIPALIAAFGISRAEAGLLGSVTLFFGAFGGWLGGALGDRFGRVKALQITVATFALATFACAFTTAYWQLVVLKAFQGLGFGAEWACGAVLMAEIIRPEHRGRALGAIQSAWAVGWGAAVLLSALVFSVVPADLGWRILFAVGLLPALLILYVRRNVPEPARPTSRTTPEPFWATMSGIFGRDVLRSTLIGGLFGIGAHGGYAALTTFLPTFLRQERQLSVLGSSAYLGVIIVAFFCGCVASGMLSDRIGRRANVAVFALACVITVLVYIFAPLTNAEMLFLGFPLGFFSAGIPASMAALFSELYPAGVRGTGVGFCYNFGRVVSAAFPVLVGFLADRIGLGPAIGIDAAVAYSLVLVAVLMLPETRGKVLEETAMARV